jgi:hypothetical protein
MTLDATIPEARSAEAIEADELESALHDAGEFYRSVIMARDTAWPALKDPAANHAASWRLIFASLAAANELYSVSPFASSRELRRVLWEANFCWLGSIGALVGADVGPMAAAIEVDGRTVH